MTGLTWPGVAMINYPVSKDFETLGLDAGQVPAQLSLCLGCSIEYMQTFNRLLEERRRNVLPSR